MLNYIIRRLLLMIPTLFGITLMVFAIARFAPGRPGPSAMGEGAVQDAEGQKKLREWYDERYGLDKPLWVQYINWWGGMIFSDTEAQAWTSNFEPIFTLRNFEPDRFSFDPESGQWFRVTSLTPQDALLAQSDPEFARLVSDPESLPIDLLEILDAYPEPGHVIAEVERQSIDPLPIDLLVPATEGRKIQVKAMAWSREGYPIYVHPDDPNRLVFERSAGAWFEINPEGDPGSWVVYGQDDPAFKAKVSRAYLRNLPEVADDRPLPRHVEVRGEPSLLEGASFDKSTLSRYMVDAEATLEAWLWTAEGDPIYVAEEPQEPKLVEGADGQWHRFLGPTWVTPPPFKTFRQSDSRFASQLTPEQQANLQERVLNQSEPRHVVMDGRLEPVDYVPTERERRRYSHEIQVMDFPLGRSETWKSSVRSVLGERLWVTLSINLIAFPIIYIIALPVGVLMALKRGQGFDASANVVMLALWSIPTVLTATLAIGYLAQGGKGLEWFPTGGLTSPNHNSMTFFPRMLDWSWHLVLPISCIVYGGFAYLAKQMRAAMLENFTMDYVRTALAKGVPRPRIVLVHVLRNSLIPIITIFATILPALIAGSVIIEKIFNIDGMGLMAFTAVTNRDYDVVQALALIFGVLNLLSLLIADIVYAIVDPRIAYK